MTLHQHFYRPRSEANDGYVFTGVCHLFCPMREEGTPTASWDRFHGQRGVVLSRGGGRWSCQEGGGGQRSTTPLDRITSPHQERSLTWPPPPPCPLWTGPPPLDRTPPPERSLTWPPPPPPHRKGHWPDHLSPPPPHTHTTYGNYGQWAGSTHPSGMHSCYSIYLEVNSVLIVKNWTVCLKETLSCKPLVTRYQVTLLRFN